MRSGNFNRTGRSEARHGVHEGADGHRTLHEDEMTYRLKVVSSLTNPVVLRYDPTNPQAPHR